MSLTDRAILFATAIFFTFIALRANNLFFRCHRAASGKTVPERSAPSKRCVISRFPICQDRFFAVGQAPCLIVADIEALYRSAKSAGAKIITELETKEYGGKAFSCSDPGGHLWFFGTYDPWENAQS